MEYLNLISNIFLGYREIMIAVVTYTAFALGLYVVRKLLLRVLKRMVERSKTTKDDLLWDKKVPHKLLNYVLVLALIGFLPAFFPEIKEIDAFSRMMTSAYIVLHMAMLLIFIDWLNMVLQQKQALKKFPINNFLQSAKLVFMGFATLLVIATLLNQSLIALISGIGALAALLSFIFKDLLLSLVASIQIAIFDLIRVDDWIEMPSHRADGDVLDISLTTIRVQNWDKTIVAIPTNAILTTPFKNWRGMSNTGARRMKKHILLDATSIKLCDETFISLMKANTKIDQSCLDDALKLMEPVKDSLTNSKLLRFYLESYLKQHPKTQENLTMMLRFLSFGAQGLPLEVYCFYKETDWVNYEHFQAEIIEYVLAVLSFFDLKVFQNPSGETIQALLKKESKSEEK